MISASPSSSTKFVLVGNIWMSPVETDYRWWLNLSVGQDSWQFHAHFYTEENKLTATQSLSLHLSVLVLMLQKLWESHNQNTFIHRLLLPVTIYYYSFYTVGILDTEEWLSGQSRLHLKAMFVYFSNWDYMFILVLFKHSIADVIFRWVLTEWPQTFLQEIEGWEGFLWYLWPT